MNEALKNESAGRIIRGGTINHMIYADDTVLIGANIQDLVTES